jgi:hypothetical protein
VSWRQPPQERPRAAQPAAAEQEPATVLTGPWVAPDAPTAARERLIEETIALWQPRCPRPVTGEEARQMIENVAGVFILLARWETEERGQAGAVPDAA